MTDDAVVILRLGGPLIINNLASAGMTFADTVMAGQLGAQALAGLAVGVSFYHIAFFIGLGVLMSIAPAVAHAYGAGDDERIGLYTRQALWLVTALSAVLMVLVWQADWVLAAIGIDAEVLPIAVAYCETVSFGLPATLAYFALRFVSEGVSRTRPIMYIAILGLALNVLNYASFMFMVPVALNSATVIHVGHKLGGGDVRGARRAGFTGIGLCGGVMLVSAVVIAFGNDVIAAVYTRDPPVRELAATLLLMAGIFQLSDGLQVGAAGALRGYKDTSVPLAVCLVSYWGIGFTLAYWLGVHRGLGPLYVWVGLIAGLSAAAVLLNWRFWRLTSRRLERVHQVALAPISQRNG